MVHSSSRTSEIYYFRKSASLGGADLQTIADAHFSKYELSARHIIKEIDISSFFKFFLNVWNWTNAELQPCSKI